MKTITCIDKTGNPHNFKYTYEIDNDDGKRIWKFIIIPEHEIYKDFFFFSAKEITDNQIKVTMINSHNQGAYSSKGIPEKIIEELQLLTGKEIISSSNNPLSKSFLEEYRTPPATKVWERLIAKGLASYDEQMDTYKFKKKNTL